MAVSSPTSWAGCHSASCRGDHPPAAAPAGSSSAAAASKTRMSDFFMLRAFLWLIRAGFHASFYIYTKWQGGDKAQKGFAREAPPIFGKCKLGIEPRNTLMLLILFFTRASTIYTGRKGGLIMPARDIAELDQFLKNWTESSNKS